MNKSLFYEKLYRWYDQNHRILPWRETQDPYKIWISEIILQQTRVAQGMEYYHRFIQRFGDVQSLAEAEEDEVLLYWQGLGYYSRARNLHAAARQIVERANIVKGDTAPSDVRSGIFPRTWEEIRQLKGVGDYTAGAIASFAYDLPYPALDGNVYRVLSRIYDSDVIFDTSAGKKHFHRLAEDLMDREHPRMFNTAIMEFGALYCTPTSPNCEACPLAAFCMAREHNTVELLPLRKPRPTLRDRYLHYAIYLTEDGRTLIHQRTERDIWQHLYEFILTEVQTEEELTHLHPLTDDTTIHPATKHVDIVHVLSHQRLHARFNIYMVQELPTIAGAQQIFLRDIDDYAFSRLTLIALEKLKISMLG